LQDTKQPGKLLPVPWLRLGRLRRTPAGPTLRDTKRLKQRQLQPKPRLPRERLTEQR